MAMTESHVGSGMGRWSAPRSDNKVPQNYNRPRNYSGGSYSDWGKNAKANYESKRGPGRGKPPQNSNRNSNQATWAGDRSPKQSHWQAQSQPPQPPPADNSNPNNSFGYYQQPPPSPQTEPQGPFAVNLQGLPMALCRKPFLEAMLDQAGLSQDITGCVLGEDQDVGKAILYVATYSGAMRCVKHFGGRRWEQAGQAVTAHIAEGQVPTTPPMQPADEIATRTQRSGSIGYAEEMIGMIPTPMPCNQQVGTWMMPQPQLPYVAFQEFPQGSDFTTNNIFAPPVMCDNGSNGNLTPLKNWGDVPDEIEKNSQHDSDVMEGSTSAGSTGRNRQDESSEVFFFGCDVDTDDGF